MRYRNFTVLFFLIGHFLLLGCSTTPVVTKEDTARTATAKRFIHNIGAGELAMISFRKELERQSNEQPGMTELLKRAFADIDKEFFENLAAETYSRHLTHKDLTEIAAFSEKPAIQKFFQVIFDGISSGNPESTEDWMRQFSADELTEIMKMSVSDSFVHLNDALPTINREMAQSSEKLGQEIIRDYLKKQ